MSNLRFEAVSEASKRKPVEVTAPSERPSEFFGKKVFNRQKMYKYLPADVYEKLIDVIDNGARLDRNIANAVAKGIKQWADENGVTHYTHWFQPLTEGTAEKHDAFIEHDGKGGMIEEFSGKLLVQQEPDASSFPSGGIRSTFEARGYSAWDPTSPVFIIDDTLCIPTVFISYTGEALDYKAPLLRSLHAVNVAATEVCHYFNPDVKKVISNLGWEQEYFLVDESLYAARPDLMLTGRTLMGHDSAKNQQMDDHYFGAIPERVQAFMKDLEIQALELGIPCKTRHNEVAPNQFELAPIFEETNLAVDHNMLLMSLMKKVARHHGFRVLLLPELHIRPRHPELVASWMPVPETPVYEYHSMVPPQHDVRTSRQPSGMQRISEPFRVQPPPHDHLRPCVLSPDPRHAIMPLLLSHRVRHG